MSTVTLSEDALERILVAALDRDRDALLRALSLERLPTAIVRRIELRDSAAFDDELEADPYFDDDDDSYEEGWDDAVQAISDAAREQMSPSRKGRAA